MAHQKRIQLGTMSLRARPLASISGIAVSYGVGCRRSLNLLWLWLWCRPVAIAPIRPLAWEPPYAVRAALEKTKDKKKKKKKRKFIHINSHSPALAPGSH